MSRARTGSRLPQLRRSCAGRYAAPAPTPTRATPTSLISRALRAMPCVLRPRRAGRGEPPRARARARRASAEAPVSRRPRPSRRAVRPFQPPVPERGTAWDGGGGAAAAAAEGGGAPGAGGTWKASERGGPPAPGIKYWSRGCTGLPLSSLGQM